MENYDFTKYKQNTFNIKFYIALENFSISSVYTVKNTCTNHFIYTINTYYNLMFTA